jgi:hypothetical protein
MRNITISLDEVTASWARLQAASRGMSVSRLVGELLQSQMHAGSDYDEAMRRYLAKQPVTLRATRQRYPTRDETHDRARLRR